MKEHEEESDQVLNFFQKTASATQQHIAYPQGRRNLNTRNLSDQSLILKAFF
jgi:hypothetical protein